MGNENFPSECPWRMGEMLTQVPPGLALARGNLRLQGKGPCSGPLHSILYVTERFTKKVRVTVVLELSVPTMVIV